MPIKGLTEIRRPQRGGYLRLGEMKLSAKGKEYPSKIDHFLPDFENKETEALFYRLYGDKPKRVTIAFPYNDPEQNFPQYYKLYGKTSGLKCKGDGDMASRYTDQGMVECPCLGPDTCDYSIDNGKNGKPGCGRIATLTFFIKGLPGLDVYQINTGSFNSIVNINSGLDMLALLRGGRPIAGVWIELELVPQTAKAEGKQVNIFTLKLNVRDSMEKLLGAPDFTPPQGLPAPMDAPDPLLHPQDGYSPEPEPTQPRTRPSQPRPSGGHPAPDLSPDIAAALEKLNPRRRDALTASAVQHKWADAQWRNALGLPMNETPAAARPAPATRNAPAPPTVPATVVDDEEEEAF